MPMASGHRSVFCKMDPMMKSLSQESSIAGMISSGFRESRVPHRGTSEQFNPTQTAEADFSEGLEGGAWALSAAKTTEPAKSVHTRTAGPLAIISGWWIAE